MICRQDMKNDTLLSNYNIPFQMKNRASVFLDTNGSNRSFWCSYFLRFVWEAWDSYRGNMPKISLHEYHCVVIETSKCKLHLAWLLYQWMTGLLKLNCFGKRGMCVFYTSCWAMFLVQKRTQFPMVLQVTAYILHFSRSLHFLSLNIFIIFQISSKHMMCSWHLLYHSTQDTNAQPKRLLSFYLVLIFEMTDLVRPICW